MSRLDSDLEVFGRALDAPERERERVLRRACAGDSEQEGRIRRFAAHERAQRTTINSGAAALAVGAMPERIGPFRVVGRLGEGGMGVVYAAEQREPVRRSVAIKLIKSGSDSAEIVARFEAERQALARMNHPCIAKMLDAAVHEGRPYFVMELVEGLPITAHCDARRLGLRARLELFRQVCAGVHHAHQKGIIHRDLKPSNILVSEEDGAASPKIIDFGIAKAIGPDAGGATLLTMVGAVIGTPDYMSPEQATTTELDVDTRTDVYSLGALLYELVTGTTVFGLAESRSDLARIRHVIGAADPERPSSRYFAPTEATDARAAERGSAAEELFAALRGDIDWITLKALEKERSRRYESAAALADDVRRHLEGEAVEAAPPSRGYRLRKLAGRNKGAVVAGGAVAAALLAGVAGFAWQAEGARRQRDRAVAAESAALARADELQKVSDFQSQMLGQLDAAALGVRLSEDVRRRFDEALAEARLSEEERRAREEAFAAGWSSVNATDVALGFIDTAMLKPALAAIEREFKDQPGVEAKLRGVVAERYTELGLYEDAAAAAARVVAVLQETLGEDDRATLEAVIAEARVRMLRGLAGESQEIGRALVARHAARLGADDPLVLRARSLVGESLSVLGRRAEAEVEFREVFEARARVLGDEHPETMGSLGSLAMTVRELGRLQEAEDIERRVLERRRQLLGREHPDTLYSLNNMAAVLLDQGKTVEAEAAFREAAEGRRRALGGGHPETLRTTANLVIALSRLGRMDEAISMQRVLYEQTRATLGPDHPDSLVALSNLGSYLVNEGKFAEAEPLCREALERRLRLYGPNNPGSLVSFNVMGFLMRRQDRPAEAEPFLRQALEASREVFGEDHPDRIVFLINTGTLARDLGKWEDAERWGAEAFERSRRVLREDHPYTRAAARAYAEALLHHKKFAEAEALLAGFAPSVRKAAESVDDGALSVLLLNLARARAGQDKFELAEAAALEARALFVSGLGVEHIRVKECDALLAEVYERWDAAAPGRGSDARARELREKAAGGAEGAGG